MSSKQIKGLTVEIGGETSKLEKALEGVTKTGKSLSSELGSINKLLKLDPTNTEMLAQKQKILSEAISNTEEKLKILKEAERQAQAQFEKGEISAEQYRGLQREIGWTEATLKQYRRAVEETAQATEKLADGADHAAHELEDQEKQTEETKRETVKLDDSMGDAVKGGFAALIAAAGAAIAAIAALAESTREYRAEMAKLDTAFKDANFNTETARKTYQKLQSIFGETDQAVEAANHLAALCSTEEELNQWTEILTGTYAKWGASLQPENLAESSNETARVGKVTGALADALNWAAAEGETFGVVMKENIDFTKRSTNELKWMTQAQREEYEARKAQYNEIEAYNKAIEEAASAEDMFNIALANCTDEQERQQLITATLTKLYGSAAKQYEKTNKEIIRANKANEEWNATLAEAGEVVEPVVTDVKELGTALLKQAKQPLKEVATYIRNTFLPNLIKIGSWIKQNLPQISATIAGVTAALVAHKVATLAAELASKGWTVATLAQAAAQKVLNAVMSATPWGLALTAVAGITAALVVFEETSKNAQSEISVLTEAEQKLIESAHESAQAFRDQQAAAKESMEGTVSQMGHIQDLANELLTLADASGSVQEKDQARANFILGQLNTALGTEYSMVDGVIQKYSELKDSVDDVISSKLANALLDEVEQGYVEAIKSKGAALEAVRLAEKAYQEQLKLCEAAAAAAAKAEGDYEKKRLAGGSAAEYAALSSSKEADALRDANSALESANNALTELKSSLDLASADYEYYSNAIVTYELAQSAALEGNYELVKELLTEESRAYVNYGIIVNDETRKVLDTLYKKAIETGEIAELIRKNFENGVSGFSKEMVLEAEQAAKDSMTAFADAYADAASVGQDLGNGLCVGLESTRISLINKGISMVKDYLAALRATADSHSPSRETIDFGEDVGEGAVIGVDNKTKDLARAGERQAEALLDAYSSQELRGQKTLIGIADKQATAQASSYVAAGAQNTGVLNKILTAIERGQILTINGDLLVGATEGTMDGALGARQILVERGAL